MRSKTLILMVIAIGCGLAASYMTSRVIADRSTKEGDEDKVTVLVARQNLAMGTLIKDPEKLFEEKAFTKGEEPKRAVRDYAQLKDHRLAKPLSAEQFVYPDDLMDKEKEGLAALMPKGMRAVGLKVNPEAIVGGFVLPNSRVDLVSVVRRGDNETYSKIILQNVLVLAVDTLSTRPDDKQAVISSTVTVQVTPAQAEKLTLATELGSLRLILRAYGDEDKVATGGVTPKGITSGSGDDRLPGEDALAANEKEAASSSKPIWGPKVPDVPPAPPVETKPAPAPPPPPPPKTHTLTIFNGDTVTKAVFPLCDKDGDEATPIGTSQPEPPAGLKPAAKDTLANP